MHRIKFIHQPQSDRDPVRSRRAVFASCAFHGLALGLLLWLTFLYRAHLPLPKSGSAPGASIITLETMVVVTPAPQPIQPPAPIPPAPVALPTPKPPDVGVPVLAIKIIKPTPPAPVKIQAPPHPMIAHATPTPSHPKPAAASSYAPGLNLLPHPPYPLEARNLGQTGTVIMNVQFDADGNVIRAEVAQSSGVPLLDSTTRSFIRAHWHSAAYAGQTISQPVEYSLENL
jgi:protein TonB